MTSPNPPPVESNKQELDKPQRADARRNRARLLEVAEAVFAAKGTSASTEEIAREACRRFPVSEVRLVHRLGPLEIGEASVAVAVASPHRDEAFSACRYAIDTLKATVPIWKKEHYADGTEWLEGPGTTTPGARDPETGQD